MNRVTIAVEIHDGKVTPMEPELLPERGRGWLTVLPAGLDHQNPAFCIENEADGLPVIRGKGGIITSALIREIEGLVG
jgi:hypothetical protein